MQPHFLRDGATDLSVRFCEDKAQSSALSEFALEFINVASFLNAW